MGALRRHQSEIIMDNQRSQPTPAKYGCVIKHRDHRAADTMSPSQQTRPVLRYFKQWPLTHRVAYLQVTVKVAIGECPTAYFTANLPVPHSTLVAAQQKGARCRSMCLLILHQFVPICFGVFSATHSSGYHSRLLPSVVFTD